MGMIGRGFLGALDYLPGVNTVPNYMRPGRSITSPNAYKREQAQGMGTWASGYGIMGGTNKKRATQARHAQALSSLPAKPNLLYAAAVPMPNKQAPQKQGGGFFDDLGNALTGKKYGGVNMSIFDRLAAGPEGVSDARQYKRRMDMQQAHMAQQRQQRQQEVGELGLTGLAAQSYITDPEAFFKEYNENFGYNNAAAGSTYGNNIDGYRMAAKLSNNDGQFYTQGPHGTVQTGDFGPTHEQQISFQNNLAKQQQAKFDGNTDFLNAQTASRNADQTQPKLHELYDPQTGQPYKALYNASTGGFDRVGGTKAPGGMNLTVGPDGTVSYGTGVGARRSFASKSGRNTADLVHGAEESAQNVERAHGLLQEADLILDSPNYTSGPNSGTKAFYGKADAFLGGMLPGDNRDFTSAHERLEAISKDLGIEKLQEVGGNDTERELLTAIQTTIGPNKLPQTNKAIIRQKQAIFDIIGQRPQFMSDWIERTGGIHNRDPQTGQSYRQAWGQYQKRAFEPVRRAFEKETQAHSDNGLSATEQAELEELERLYGGQ